jgi:ribose-phosphate pyrophosphokinase
MQIVFSITSYHYLLQKVLATSLNLLAGEMQIETFPDGEMYHRFITDLKNKEVIIIGGTCTDKDTMELLDIAEGSIQCGAKSVTIVVPYFGYSTMERMVHPGEIVKAKNRALLLSSIMIGNISNKILLFDLHSEGIPYYFDKNVRVQHVYCKQLIMQAAMQLGGDDFVMAATDAGRAKWVESLAQEMNVSAAFVYKNRQSGTATSTTGINAQVTDKTVIIYDDMIRTGGSLMQAAALYKSKGAKQIFVITTHGLFCNNALEKIADQGIIQKIICTDSHVNTNANLHPIVSVISIADLIVSQL